MTVDVGTFYTQFDDRVREIVAYAYEQAPAIRRIFDDAGLTPADIESVDDLAKVPITRKDELIELQRADPPFGGFLGVPISQVKRVFQSPGPLYDPEGRKEDYWRFGQALRSAGFQAGDIVQNTVSYHLTPLGFMFDDALRSLGCVVVPAGPGNTETQLQIIRDLGVNGFTGVPSYLMTLIERAEEQGLDWQRDVGITKAFVAAEPFPPSLRQAFVERGITAREGYGTADTGNLGFECEEAAGWHIPPDVIVQVIDLNTGRPTAPGEEGEIVVTLLEETYPLIRFGTGDLSAINAEPCPCGRATPRLVGWLGRVGQAVKVRGMFVHPRQLAQVMQRFPAVARYQAIVERPGTLDELSVRLEPTADASLEGQLADISQALREVLKVRARLDVVAPGTMPGNAPPIEDRRTWE
ncbi:MAG: phenylacetate--CoA ligase family protein [Anaerolineae bacterium]